MANEIKGGDVLCKTTPKTEERKIREVCSRCNRIIKAWLSFMDNTAGINRSAD